jgi:hypothetical protein
MNFCTWCDIRKISNFFEFIASRANYCAIGDVVLVSFFGVDMKSGKRAELLVMAAISSQSTINLFFCCFCPLYGRHILF